MRIFVVSVAILTVLAAFGECSYHVEPLFEDSYVEDYDEGISPLQMEVVSSDAIQGIYVDFIYNPNYYYELTVLKFMLDEIIGKNPNVPIYYDYHSLPNSTKITVGPENLILQQQRLITVKPKLLKDILYNQDIFSRIYAFLYAYFQAVISDPTKIPEYDRYINFNRYTSMFNRELTILDSQSKVVCRNQELYDKYQGRLCIFPDIAYINSIPFKHESTRAYWTDLLWRISDFTSIMLSDAIQVNASLYHTEPCYRIDLLPEPNVRAVLLFGHKAVKSASLDDKFTFDASSKDRIASDVILFKHRILHALGVGHKYASESVMRFYNVPWQKNNMFFLMPEDAKLLNQCYQKYFPSNRYIKNEQRFNERLFQLFIEDYLNFRKEYKYNII